MRLPLTCQLIPGPCWPAAALVLSSQGRAKLLPSWLPAVLFSLEDVPAPFFHSLPLSSSWCKIIYEFISSFSVHHPTFLASRGEVIAPWAVSVSLLELLTHSVARRFSMNTCGLAEQRGWAPAGINRQPCSLGIHCVWGGGV